MGDQTTDDIVNEIDWDNMVDSEEDQCRCCERKTGKEAEVYMTIRVVVYAY